MPPANGRRGGADVTGPRAAGGRRAPNRRAPSPWARREALPRGTHCLGTGARGPGAGGEMLRETLRPAARTGGSDHGLQRRAEGGGAPGPRRGRSGAQNTPGCGSRWDPAENPGLRPRALPNGNYDITTNQSDGVLVGLSTPSLPGGGAPGGSSSERRPLGPRRVSPEALGPVPAPADALRPELRPTQVWVPQGMRGSVCLPYKHGRVLRTTGIGLGAPASRPGPFRASSVQRARPPRAAHEVGVSGRESRSPPPLPGEGAAGGRPLTPGDQGGSRSSGPVLWPRLPGDPFQGPSPPRVSAFFIPMRT